MKKEFKLEENEVVIETFKGSLGCNVGLLSKRTYDGTFTITNKRIHHETYTFILQTVTDIYFNNIVSFEKKDFLFLKLMIEIKTNNNQYMMNLFNRDKKYDLVMGEIQRFKEKL